MPGILFGLIQWGRVNPEPDPDESWSNTNRPVPPRPACTCEPHRPQGVGPNGHDFFDYHQWECPYYQSTRRRWGSH